ncbi:hypothetical protein Ciccas_005742 [Cichlidogyrus casuarinus]|uniref:Rab3 GTPase-activating protein catalytic subunit n=1 Tax=Cichlidogyrus casuarinus TaxID=1844966 RepID=A0ABD2Q7S8_9PLAT
MSLSLTNCNVPLFLVYGANRFQGVILTPSSATNKDEPGSISFDSQLSLIRHDLDTIFLKTCPNACKSVNGLYQLFCDKLSVGQLQSLMTLSARFTYSLPPFPEDFFCMPLIYPHDSRNFTLPLESFSSLGFNFELVCLWPNVPKHAFNEDPYWANLKPDGASTWSVRLHVDEASAASKMVSLFDQLLRAASAETGLNSEKEWLIANHRVQADAFQGFENNDIIQEPRTRKRDRALGYIRSMMDLKPTLSKNDLPEEAAKSLDPTYQLKGVLMTGSELLTFLFVHSKLDDTFSLADDLKKEREFVLPSNWRYDDGVVLVNLLTNSCQKVSQMTNVAPDARVNYEIDGVSKTINFAELLQLESMRRMAYMWKEFLLELEFRSSLIDNKSLDLGCGSEEECTESSTVSLARRAHMDVEFDTVADEDRGLDLALHRLKCCSPESRLQSEKLAIFQWLKTIQLNTLFENLLPSVFLDYLLHFHSICPHESIRSLYEDMLGVLRGLVAQIMDSYVTTDWDAALGSKYAILVMRPMACLIRRFTEAITVLASVHSAIQKMPKSPRKQPGADYVYARQDPRQSIVDPGTQEILSTFGPLLLAHLRVQPNPFEFIVASAEENQSFSHPTALGEVLLPEKRTHSFLNFLELAQNSSELDWQKYHFNFSNEPNAFPKPQKDSAASASEDPYHHVLGGQPSEALFRFRCLQPIGRPSLLSSNPGPQNMLVCLRRGCSPKFPARPDKNSPCSLQIYGSFSCDMQFY